jgi:hypothetical protein
MNPNGTPANLKPFQVGNPGGPGRPRKRPISEAYDDLLRTQLPETERKALKLKPGVTWAEAIALSRARHALTRAGVESAREMREATEGKAVARFELGSGEDRTPEFVVVYATAIPGGKAFEPAIDVKAELPDDEKQLPEGRDADEGSSKPPES